MTDAAAIDGSTNTTGVAVDSRKKQKIGLGASSWTAYFGTSLIDATSVQFKFEDE